MRVTGIPYIQGRNAYTDKDGLKFGIAIHDTSNDGTAEQEADYATRRTDGISSHFYVDRDSIIQSIDTRDRCGHAGSSTGNENAVCVEITGFNSWTRQQWLDNVAWPLLVSSLKQVIASHWPDGSFQIRRASVSEMQSNPKVKAFYGHDDMRLAWGGTDHTDPGPNFPWDYFLGLFDSSTPISGGNDVSAIIRERVDAGQPPGRYFVLAPDNSLHQIEDIDSLGWIVSGRYLSPTQAPQPNVFSTMYGNPKATGAAPWIEIPVVPLSAFAVKTNSGGGGDCPSANEIAEATRPVVRAEIDRTVQRNSAE